MSLILVFLAYFGHQYVVAFGKPDLVVKFKIASPRDRETISAAGTEASTHHDAAKDSIAYGVILISDSFGEI